MEAGGVRVASSSVNNTKVRLSLLKKMAMQLAICSVIYIIFYLIKNTNYIFSDDVISKTKELLSYDINFQNVYEQVSTFVENNKDKFKLPEVIRKNGQEGENGINNEQTNKENIVENTQAENVVANEVNGGIGGAGENEVIEEKTKTQLKEEKRKEREQREAEKKNRVKRQNIEKEIEETEAKIEEMDVLLCQEEVYSNPEKSKDVSLQKASLEEKLSALYEEWESLM